MIYVTVGDDGTEFHTVMSQDTFATAELAIINPNPPDVLNQKACRLAAVIMHQGTVDIVSIVDQRPKLGQLAAGGTAVTIHSQLQGLAANDHPQYQLTTGKNASNGYCPLDAGILVPVANLNTATSAPGTVAVGAAAVGAGPKLAFENHNHSISVGSPVAVGAANNDGLATSVSKSDHVHAHGAQTDGTMHAAVIAAGASGFMTGVDKTKIDGIASGATANVITNTAPVNVTKSAANVGASSELARADHKHDVSTAAPSGIVPAVSNTEGSATSLARSDHGHAFASSLVQTGFVALATDQSNATAGSYSDLTGVSLNITTGARPILIHFSVTGDNSATNNNTFFEVDVDGVRVGVCAFNTAASGRPQSASMVIKTSALTAATHTVKIRWRPSSGTSRVRPVTNPDSDRASLLVEEVSV